MNKRAQAGLEYMVTYGWALMLVVTFVGVLVMITGTPQEEFSCRSSDPTKIDLKGVLVPSTGYVNFNGFEIWSSGGTPPWMISPSGTNKIILQNFTGGDISIYDVKCGNYLGADTDCCPLPSSLFPELGLIRSCDVRPPTMQVAGVCVGNYPGWCPNRFAPETVLSSDNQVTVSAGNEFEIIDFVINYDPNAARRGQPYVKIPPGYIKLFYKDISGLDRTVTIDCHGLPPRP